MTGLESLTAISPIDGRYRNKCVELAPLLSEYGLIAARVEVEVAWFKHLSECLAFDALPNLSAGATDYLDNLVSQFSLDAARAVKEIEKTTNHDVKAVEYYLKSAFEQHAELAPYKEFIHFACTSEDINNLSYALIIMRAREQHVMPRAEALLNQLIQWAGDTAEVPLLARTHGQSATPTTVGKEFANFAARLQRQMQSLAKVEILGKFNGAVGNYNAHAVAYPEIDWPRINKDFIEALGLTFNPYTTQIEPHDMIAEYCHALFRCNQIIKDLNRDMWSYISLGYFKQKVIAGEVGSSTMPHKVNPIDFENSEGNIGIANQALLFFSEQLTNSRWQRDLVDSTVLRNLGVAIAHTDIAWQATMKGLAKCECVVELIANELNQHWEVLAEAVQTVMRRYQIDNPYEQLKAMTRGKQLTQASYHDFVQTLAIPDEAKQQLLQLTPSNYLGYAIPLAKAFK